ncbi:hypothetical protein BH23GEM4_BH23GEM4_05470 [soil metagenome]
MTTKELIRAEIERVGEEYMDELHALIRTFARSKQRTDKQSLMAKLKTIRIDAPEDFAADFDLYAR